MFSTENVLGHALQFNMNFSTCKDVFYMCASEVLVLHTTHSSLHARRPTRFFSWARRPPTQTPARAESRRSVSKSKCTHKFAREKCKRSLAREILCPICGPPVRGDAPHSHSVGSREAQLPACMNAPLCLFNVQHLTHESVLTRRVHTRGNRLMSLNPNLKSLFGPTTLPTNFGFHMQGVAYISNNSFVMVV
jgi:hypothetical protein